MLKQGGDFESLKQLNEDFANVTLEDGDWWRTIAADRPVLVSVLKKVWALQPATARPETDEKNAFRGISEVTLDSDPTLMFPGEFWWLPIDAPQAAFEIFQFVAVMKKEILDGYEKPFTGAFIQSIEGTTVQGFEGTLATKKNAARQAFNALTAKWFWGLWMRLRPSAWCMSLFGLLSRKKERKRTWQ